VTAFSSTLTRLPDGRGQDARPDIPVYVWLMLAGLVATMFSGHMAELGVPVPVDRLLIAAAALLLLLDPARERLRWRSFYLVAGLTVIWTALSWVSNGSVTDVTKLFALTDRVLIPLLMFPLGALIFTTARRRELGLRTLSLLGIYLGITGFFEYLRIYAFVFPSYIANYADPNGDAVAAGPWTSKEPFGMVSALALFASILLARTTTSTLWRWISHLGAIGGLVGSVLCMTRTVWLAVPATGLIVALLQPKLRRKLPLLILAGVALGAAFLFAFPEFRDALLTRLLTERSVYDRQNTNAAALRIIAALPLFGIGWGEFINQNLLWVRQADTYPVTNVTIEVHNVFLSRAAETGVLGAVLWVLCFATGPLLGLLAQPRTREAMQWKLLGLGAFLVWIIPSLSSPNPYPTPNLLIWLIWGVAARGILVDLPTPVERVRAEPPAPAA